MDWTEAQREAIETRGRSVLVAAGAGSGKTRVLVERFLRLLEENPDWRVFDIVAVTFTEKAAREMVSRIRREIRSRIEESADAEARRRWREHRNALDSARIGTIHALCAAILRAHPAEAGLDPGFAVTEEMEAAALLDRAIEETIFEAAREQTAETEVLAQLPNYEVREAIRSLIAQGERARRAVAKFAGATAADVTRIWRETITRYRDEAAEALTERDDWKRAAAVVTGLRALRNDDRIEVCRAQAADLLDTLTFSDGEERLAALLELARCINLTGGVKKNWPSEEALKAVKEALKHLREAVRAEKLLALEWNDADTFTVGVVLNLIRLYERASRYFAERKDRHALLDFNDLEEMTERLLATHEDVRSLYAGGERLRALMVDEFQDTSPIQTRILRMIAPGRGSSLSLATPSNPSTAFAGRT